MTRDFTSYCDKNGYVLVCFVLHCLHEYPSNVSLPVTVITIYKCLDFGLQRTFNINNDSRCYNII